MRLRNPYGVMLVSAAKHPQVKTAEGQKFVDWVTGPVGQAVIAGDKIGGEQLFSLMRGSRVVWEVTINQINQKLVRMNNIPHPRYPNPTATDQADFLLRLYFGPGDDLLVRAIKRAYQDLSRTVHGIGDHPEARPKAAAVLREGLKNLAVSQSSETQKFFDDWHRKTCASLCQAYADAGYKSFTIGQAQKWLNMAVKYVFVFGEQRLPSFGRFFRFAHVPIDNIILESKAFEGLRTFRERWSRIRSYDDYLAFQDSVRKRFPDSAPLAVEFWVWQASTPSNI